MKILKEKPKARTSKSEFQKQLEEANAFFNDPSLPKSSQLLEEDNPYADKDGLIQFIIGNELIDNAEVMEELNKQKKILVALGSIVTDYVFRYAEQNGMDYKTDAALWELAVSKLPLMSFSGDSEQTYQKHSKGIEIAVSFIEMILDIVAEQESQALDKFREFLTNQGDSLRAGVETNEASYKTFTFGGALEVFQVGEEFVYTPKIKTYQANFNRSNYEFSFFCGSYKEVDIAFDYMYSATIFDYQALEDPEIKTQFDTFINDNRKAAIEDSKTFFQGDIPPVPKTQPPV